jgi:hypothetical protein
MIGFLILCRGYGGWIENEYTLSHDENAGVSDNARVFDNARVSGNTKVVVLHCYRAIQRYLSMQREMNKA